MSKNVPIILIISIIFASLPAACNRPMDGYMPASAISQAGHGTQGGMGAMTGLEAQVWVFVDHGKLYGDEGARAILGDRPRGEGPDGTTPRFHLNGRESDPTDHAFAVSVPSDPERDDLLRRFVTDAAAGRPTRVFVAGRWVTFDAPLNTGSRTGLHREPKTSNVVRFASSRSEK